MRQGWYIQYIDRDPVVLARQEALERTKKREMDDQQRHERHLDKLVREAKSTGEAEGAKPEFTGLARGEGDDEPVRFGLGVSAKKKPVMGAAGGPVPISAVFGEDDEDDVTRMLKAAPKPKEFKVPEFMQSLPPLDPPTSTHSAPKPASEVRC